MTFYIQQTLQVINLYLNFKLQQEQAKLKQYYIDSSKQMGCGSSMNQISDSYHSINSSKPLKVQQMFQNSQSITQINKMYLFGQTQTKRKILQLTIEEIIQQIRLNKISQKFHIPRPKIQRDTVQMMYQQAQQVFPLNMYNSTTLPPFNLMFVTLLSQKVLFMCGGVDFQFWNVCSQSFLYKIANPNDLQKSKKGKLQKPQSQIVHQKTTNNKEPISKRAFNKFQRLSFMNQGRYSHMGISVKHPLTGKNFAYVFGGYGSNKQALRSCQKYSFEKNIWQKMIDLSLPRATGFCFQYIQKIYVFGGFTNDRKRSKKIEVWDLVEQRWEVLNIKLHQGIEQGFLSSFKPNQIIIMGGNAEGGSIQSVIRCNIIEQTYEWDSNLIYADSLQKGMNYQNQIYLFGGQKPFTCQIYNQKARKWTQKKIQTSLQIKSGQLTLFSFLARSVNVDFLPNSSRKKQKEFDYEDIIIFGTDTYPIMISYSSKNLFVASRSVPMRIRLRKKMGIIRLSADQYFICGGIDYFQTNPTKATFNYNVSTKIGTQLAKMPLKKYNFGIIKHDHFIYCMGGCIKNQRLQQVQVKQCCRFNLIKKQWQRLPELNYRRSQCQIVQVQNNLMIYGGYCDGQWVQKIQILKLYEQKITQFTLLAQRIPLLLPVYSTIVKTNNSLRGKIYKLFVFNRNIHLNNFEQVYFEINMNKITQKQKSSSKKLKKFDISKLQQFDSIQVMINQKRKSIQKQSEDNNFRYLKSKSPTIDEQNMNDSLMINQGSSNRGVDKSQSEKNKIKLIDSLTQQQKKKYNIYNINRNINTINHPNQQQQQHIKSPSVIIIKSINNQNQQDEIQQIHENIKKDNHHKNNSKNEYSNYIENRQLQIINYKKSGNYVREQKNNCFIIQVQKKFQEDPEDIQKLNADLDKIKFENQNNKNLKNQNNKFQNLQNGAHKYEKLNTEPLSQQKYQENAQLMNKKQYQKDNNNGKSTRHNNQNQNQIQSQPQILDGYTKGQIKGLQSISNINEWIIIKKQNLVVFVRNQQLIKSKVQKNNDKQQIKITIVRQRYENQQGLFDEEDQKNNNRIHTKYLRQNHG